MSIFGEWMRQHDREMKELLELNAELLESCKAMRDTLYCDKSWQAVQADKVIAKAERLR
jgi:hypothetical protein